MVFDPFEVEKKFYIIKKYDDENENRVLYNHILSKEIKNYYSLLNDKLRNVIKTLDDFINDNYKNFDMDEEENNNMLKSENEELKNYKNGIEIELNNLKKDIINQENKYKKSINEKDQEIISIKEEFYKKENELKKKIEALIKGNMDKENKINNMNKELEKNKKEINDLYQKKNNYESLLNYKDEEIEKLKNESTEKYKENEVYYKNKISILEKENEKLKNKIDEIKNELNNESEKNKKLIEENKIFKNNEIKYIDEINEYKKKEEKYNNIDNSMKKKEEILNKREQELLIKEQELNKNISLLEKERELFKEKNKQIKRENEEILKKHSNKEEFFEQSKDEKQKMNPKVEINKPKKKMLKCPTLIGLNNIGAIGFMNGILQCLSQTKSLTNYFLNSYNKGQIINNNIAVENEDALQLCPVYLELIEKLWDNNMKEPYSPYNFKNIVEAMNSSFKQGKGGDYKDFIVFILEQLHKELKKINNNNVITSLSKDESFDQYEKSKILNNYLNKFKNECSIISDTFFGYYEISNECLKCKDNYHKKHLENPKSYKLSIFNCITFSLEEIQKMKNNSNLNNIEMNQNNVFTLYDCFYYMSKKKVENKNICNICNQLADFISTTLIYSSPSVLILILKWGKNNNINLNYKENIDITKFIQQEKSSNIIYNLYGVISQIEGSNGNFVASCKSHIDNKWYRYNDAIVKHITNVQKDVIEFGIPCILFYIKC